MNPHSDAYGIFRVINGEPMLVATAVDPNTVCDFLNNHTDLNLSVTGPGDQDYSEPLTSTEWLYDQTT
jgi:hypothetical protein